MRNLSARCTQTHSQSRESLSQPLINKNHLNQSPASCWLIEESVVLASGEYLTCFGCWGGRGEGNFPLLHQLSAVRCRSVRPFPVSPSLAGDSRWFSPCRVCKPAMLQSRVAPSRTTVCALRKGKQGGVGPNPAPLFASPLSTCRQRLCLSDDSTLEQGEWQGRMTPPCITNAKTLSHTCSWQPASNSCLHWAHPASCRLLQEFAAQVPGCKQSSWVSAVKHWFLLKANISAKKGRVQGTIQSYPARLSMVLLKEMHHFDLLRTCPTLYSIIRRKSQITVLIGRWSSSQGREGV